MYIEVYYLSKMNYVSSKRQEYEEKEIEEMYRRTVGKMKQEKKEVLVCIRDGEHQLIKSELCHTKKQ